MSMCKRNHWIVFHGNSGFPEFVRVRRFGRETYLHEQWMARSASELLCANSFVASSRRVSILCAFRQTCFHMFGMDFGARGVYIEILTLAPWRV